MMEQSNWVLIPIISKWLYGKHSYLNCMAIERSLKNLLLLVLAVIVVLVLWHTIWFLIGLVVFAIVVYFIYLLLKGTL